MNQKSIGDQLRQKLENIKKNIKTDEAKMLPLPSSWKGDGVDHINIADDAKTILGVALSHSACLEFEHSIFGKFDTVTAFWHYIRVKNKEDRIRKMTPRALQSMAKTADRMFVYNFKAIIMDANYQKIKQHHEIFEVIKESELPFDCYYLKALPGDSSRKIPTRHSFTIWLVNGFEEIRKAIKEDREPNFEFLRDETDCNSIYDKMLEEISVAAS